MLNTTACSTYSPSSVTPVAWKTLYFGDDSSSAMVAQDKHLSPANNTPSSIIPAPKNLQAWVDRSIVKFEKLNTPLKLVVGTGLVVFVPGGIAIVSGYLWRRHHLKKATDLGSKASKPTDPASS